MSRLPYWETIIQYDIQAYAAHMEDALEYYEIYYKDVFLGVLIYDVKLRKHKFISNAEGIS